MKHARKSSGPFCMVRFLRDADGARVTYTTVARNGEPVVFLPKARPVLMRALVVPTWRVGRGRLTLNKVAHA